MSQPKRYVQQPVEVEAFKLNGYGDFVRAQEWVNDSGGVAHFIPYTSHVNSVDALYIVTANGNLEEARDGWYVIRGVQGFYTVRSDVFEASHVVVEEPAIVEPLTGTGSYVVGRPDGRTALVGGAAKQLPGPADV